jgi:hypothetical protein
VSVAPASVTRKPDRQQRAFAVREVKGQWDMEVYVSAAVPAAVIELTLQYHTGSSRNCGGSVKPLHDMLARRSSNSMSTKRK